MKKHWKHALARVLLIGSVVVCNPLLVKAVTGVDNFNRANGAVGSNWLVSGNIGVVSNALKITSGSTDSWMSWSASSFGADQFSQTTITGTTTQDNHAVAVRMAAGAKTFYFCDGGAIHYIGRFVSGAHTILKTVAVSIRANDILRCEVQGNTIRYVVNGATIDSITDGSLTSGRAGMFLSTSDGIVDDWSGGDLGTSPPPPVDTQAPGTPAAPQSSGITSTSIGLSWTTPTDNVGVTGCQLFRNGAMITSTATAQFLDTNLTPSTTYTYTVRAFDAAGNMSSQSPALTAATASQTPPPPPSPSMFPVRYSANGHYLVDQNGTPFPILGRTAWFVISLPVSGYQTFIADSVSRGYNGIEMHVLDHDGRGNNPPFAGNGTAPFLKRLDGSNWNGALSGSAPDFSTPNEAYWSFVDNFLNYCESQGVLVFMFPAYTGYAGGSQGWMQEMSANGTAKMNSYGSFLSNRYKNQRNLVWMMGGDFGSGSLPFSQAQTDVENALMTGLKSATPQQSIYFSAEWVRGSIGTDQTTFGSAMTLNSVYASSQEVNDLGRRAYSYSPVRPAYLLEEPYDQEGSDGNLYNSDATQPVRRFQWWGWLSTIGGYISGNGYVWPFVSPNWQNHLDTQGSRDMARMNAFIKSIAWSDLVPSGLNGMKTLITAGGGTSYQDNYISAAATPSGSLMVAYIGPGHTGSFTVDMTAMHGTARARWYNPVDATYTTVAGSPFPNTGSVQFTPPGNNGTGYADWALVLDTSVVADTVAPSTPSNLQTSNVTASSIKVSWTASTDNVGVAGYTIYRNGAQVGTTTQTFYTSAGLAPLTTYTFTVKAYDGSGNVSALSPAVSGTTTNTPPSVPQFVKLTEARATASGNTVATPGFGSPVTSGNLIAVWVWYNSNAQNVSSISDSAGNTYIRAVGPATGTGAMSGWRQELWYAKDIAGGSSVSVTAVFNAAFSGEKAITAHEYSGLDTASPLDVTVSTVTSSANASSGPLNTNFANELIFGAVLFQGSGTAGSGFVQRSSLASNASEDMLVYAAGSYPVTFTNGSQSAIVQAVAFKAAGQ